MLKRIMADNTSQKLRGKGIALVIMGLCLALAFFIGVRSWLSIAGFAIAETKTATDTMGLSTEHGVSRWAWTPTQSGKISSIKISGNVSGVGTAALMLEVGGTQKQIYTFNYSPEFNADTKNLSDGVVLHPLKKIVPALGYGNEPFSDAENDGAEDVTGIVDFSLSDSVFNWSAGSEYLCSQWEVYSIDGKQTTPLCYGSSACCGLIGLSPARTEWNESFFLSYNQHGATARNLVYARIIASAGLNESDSLTTISEWKAAKAIFTKNSDVFTNVCGEICDISATSPQVFNFIIESVNTTVFIDSISYRYTKERKAGLKQKKFLPSLTVTGYETYSLNLSEYFSSDLDITYQFYPVQNIDIEFIENTALIFPNQSTGVVYTYVIANDSRDMLISNIFAINITPSLPREEPSRQLSARVGAPVRWSKKVIMEQDALSINLTPDVSNVIIQNLNTSQDLAEKDIFIVQGNTAKNLKEFKERRAADKKEKPLSIAGQASDEGTLSSNITLRINESLAAQGQELLIEYETPAPLSFEKNVSKNKKQVTISSEYSYTDVVAFTSVGDVSQQAINLYWIVNEEKIMVNASNITYLDTNNNNLIDEIEWTVPHLSNQTYEVVINVFNIHSYPTLYGNWTVEFNTSGTGNLTITAFGGTSYSEFFEDDNATEDDLELLELKCGNTILFNKDNQISQNNVFLLSTAGQKLRLSDTIGQSVPVTSLYIENYSCDNSVAYHTVKTLTTGGHYQLLNFSGSIAAAYNTVAGETCDEGDNLTLCVILTVKGITNNSVLQYHNLSIRNGGALRNQTAGTFFRINATNIIIESGGRIEGNVNITAANITILSGGLLNASYLGFAGGASGDTSANSGKNGSGIGSGLTGDGTGGGRGGGGAGYGGSGGSGFGSTTNSPGGISYDAAINPRVMGSGGAGGDCANSQGGFGGGMIFINATGIVNITGNITVHGGNTPDTICGEQGAYSGGGGSGGSAMIIAQQFAGGGSIAARGGTAGGNFSNGGGGAGGRIAVYSQLSSFAGRISSAGGTGFGNGSTGTNFSAENLSIGISLSQSAIDPNLNLSILGSVRLYQHNHPLINTTMTVYLDGVLLFYNESSRRLTNSSSEEHTNATKTDNNGLFNYTLAVPDSIKTYTLIVNTSVFTIAGTNSTTFSIDTNPPSINGSLNTTSPKIYDVVNATFAVNDSAGLSQINISVNLSGNPPMVFSFALSGTSAQISQNFTVNLTRGNVLNVTGVAIDAGGNIRQNSTLITIANTPPTAASIINASGRFYNRNQTINWTSADADGDMLNFTVWFSKCLKRSNRSTEFFSTPDYNFTTNMTSDWIYCLNITVTDGIEQINQTSIWNITLDTVIPLITNLTINSTNVKKNDILDITINLTDINIVSSTVNLTINVSGASSLVFNYTIDNATLDDFFDILLIRGGGAFGSVVESGDVNGDGFADIIVADYSKSVGGKSIAGVVYVYYNNRTMDTTADLDLNLSTAAENSDQFGVSVALGDVNADGYLDIIIGADRKNDGGSDSGAAYVYFGNASMDTQFDINITGHNINDDLGASVASGDVNGDGVDDAIIGIPFYDYSSNSGAGAVFVYFGESAIDTAIDVNLTGQASDSFGSSLISGDINNDGFDDIIVGATAADGYFSGSGSVFIYYGNSTIQNSTLSNADVELPGYQGNPSNEFGFSVALGDINGDGFRDVIVGERMSNSGGSDSGSVYAFFSSSGVMDTQVDINLTGSANNDFFGDSVSSGDLNGDGYDDIVIGAPFNDELGLSSGKTYIYFGSKTVRNNTFDAYLYPRTSGDDHGHAVKVNDIDNDGFADIIVGATTGGTGNGEAIIYLGGINRALVSQNITINLTRNNVLNISVLAQDAAGNLNRRSINVTISNSPPQASVVNTSGMVYAANQRINWTASDADGDSVIFRVYFSRQCPPNAAEFFDTADFNFTTNMTADGTYCLNISANDSVSRSTVITGWNISLDTLAPVINVSVNKSSPRIYDVINITLNMTDPTGLVRANLTVNSTGRDVLNFSFTVSGTSAEASQLITINVTRGNVINITGFAFDAINNIKQNSTLLTIANTPPVAATILNTSGQIFLHNQTIGWTASDNDNDTLTYTVYFSAQCPPSAFEFIITQDTNFTTNITSENIHCLNVTVNDSSDIVGISTLWNISVNTSPDTLAPSISVSLNKSAPKINEVLNISLNLSDERELGTANLTLNISGKPVLNFFFDVVGKSVVVSQNITINLSRNNVINITGLVIDDAGNTQQVSTTVTVNNTLPTISIDTTSGQITNTNQTIQWTAIDPDRDTLNFTAYFSKMCPPNALEFFSTNQSNITTNMTINHRYCLNLTVTDGLAVINTTAVWNITLDTATPTITLSVNNSNPQNKAVINITVQSRDARALSSINISLNISNTQRQSFNYSVGDFTLSQTIGKTLNDDIGIRTTDVIAAGDINGDGFDDVLVSSSFITQGGVSDDIYGYFGGPDMDLVFDVNITGRAGMDTKDIAIGDVNGDGIGDIIHGDLTGVYIYFGNYSFDTGRDVYLPSNATSLAATDINRDGFDDVIIGYTPINDGWAYIYFGGAPMDNATDVIIHNSSYSGSFGQSVAAGKDINADGYLDAVIGAYTHNSSGAVFIVYGNTTFKNNSISKKIPGTTEYNGQFGTTVALGDINGDTIGDVVVGTLGDDGGGTDFGAVFVYFGSAQVDTQIDVNLTGFVSNDRFGADVSAKDLDDDGFDEIVTTTDSGGAGGDGYAYRGSASMENTILTTLDDSYLLQQIISANDINGDGFNDVIASTLNNGAYVYFGGGEFAESSQNVTIPLIRGNILNITSIAFDIAGNRNQTSTLLTIADTPAFNVSITFNTSTFRIATVFNISIAAVDYDRFSAGVISHNASGYTINTTYPLSGDSITISQNSTINLTAGNIINVTVYLNDTVGTPVYMNSTLITVSNTPPQPPTILFPLNNSDTNIIPLPVNVTFPHDADGHAITIYYYLNTLFNTTLSGNSTFNLSDGFYNFTVGLYDGTNFSVNTTINVTYDTTEPKIDIYRIDRITDKRHIIINGTINETNTLMNVTVYLNETYIANASTARLSNSLYVFNVTVNLTEGWNRYTVLAYDRAGNFKNQSSSEQGASILSDTSPPIIRLITAPNGSTLANGSVISFEIKDKALISAFYKINDQSAQSFNFIFDIDAQTPEWQQGTNYLTVNASDNKGVTTTKNYSFGFSTDYAVFLNVSINYMRAVINDTNATKNNLLNDTELLALLSDSSATVTLAEYNSTISALGLITNLSNAVTSLDTILSAIYAINASVASTPAKTENISIEISNARVVRNNTLSTVRITLRDANISEGGATAAVLENISQTVIANESLSSAEQATFNSTTDSLQSSTSIQNSGTVMETIFVNGRQINTTLIEKQVNLSSTSSFYLNEFIDKNITGEDALSVSATIENKADEGTYSIIADDPIVRWSFSNKKSAVIKYTIRKALDADGLTKANTVITAIPSRIIGTDSGSSSSSAGSGSSSSSGGGLPAASLVRASAEKQFAIIAPDMPAVFDIENPAIGVRQILLDVKSKVEGAAIEVASLADVPDDISPPASGGVYQYLRIEKQNIKSEEIKKATITYTVPKSWFSREKIAAEEIALFRYTDGWQQLPTRITGADQSQYYFESVSSGFSIFSIAKKGADIFSITPSSVSLTGAVGQTQEASLTIQNLIDKEITLTITGFGIGSSIQQTTQTLGFAAEKNIVLTFRHQRVGISVGKLVITAHGKTQEVFLLLTTTPSQQTAYFNLTSSALLLAQNEPLPLHITFTNVSTYPFRATINYFVKDTSNKILYQATETLDIESAVLDKYIQLPKNIAAGKYAVVVDILTDTGMMSSALLFTVASPPALQQPTLLVNVTRAALAGLVILLMVAVLDVFAYQRYVFKKIREHQPLSILFSIDTATQKIKPSETLILHLAIVPRDLGFINSKAILRIQFRTSKGTTVSKQTYQIYITNEFTMTKRFRVPAYLGAGNYTAQANIIIKGEKISSMPAEFTVYGATNHSKTA